MKLLTLIALLTLAACQQITYHNEGPGSINVEGSAPSQERGRNSPDVLTEPDVSVVP